MSSTFYQNVIIRAMHRNERKQILFRCHKFDEGLKALLERTDKSSGMMAV